MCVCMYVYIKSWVYIYTHMYTYIHSGILVYVYRHILVSMHFYKFDIYGALLHQKQPSPVVEGIKVCKLPQFFQMLTG